MTKEHHPLELLWLLWLHNYIMQCSTPSFELLGFTPFFHTYNNVSTEYLKGKGFPVKHYTAKQCHDDDDDGYESLTNELLSLPTAVLYR